MNMNFYFLTVLTFLTSCASTKFVGTEGLSDQDIATITSSCDSVCQKKIIGKFHLKRSGSILNQAKAVSYLVVSEVNGKKGDNTYFDQFGSFNSTWDGSYQIKTKPGMTTLFVYPQMVRVAPKEGRYISFYAEKGKTYLVARLQKGFKLHNIQVNHWAPLIVNLETFEILKPVGSEPDWSKYCFAAKEFGGAVEC